GAAVENHGLVGAALRSIACDGGLGLLIREQRYGLQHDEDAVATGFDDAVVLGAAWVENVGLNARCFRSVPERDELVLVRRGLLLGDWLLLLFDFFRGLQAAPIGLHELDDQVTRAR